MALTKIPKLLGFPVGLKLKSPPWILDVMRMGSEVVIYRGSYWKSLILIHHYSTLWPGVFFL
jgi:hypothetical protein